METVGSSQVDERPASFRRLRVVDVDKEGRSFRLLVVKKGLKNPSLRALINKIVCDAPGLWQLSKVGVGQCCEGVGQQRGKKGQVHAKYL